MAIPNTIGMGNYEERVAHKRSLVYIHIFPLVIRRNVLDGRTMIEQLSELERRSDPVAVELAGVWTSSYAVVSEILFVLFSP